MLEGAIVAVIRKKRRSNMYWGVRDSDFMQKDRQKFLLSKILSRIRLLLKENSRWIPSKYLFSERIPSIVVFI